MQPAQNQLHVAVEGAAGVKAIQQDPGKSACVVLQLSGQTGCHCQRQRIRRAADQHDIGGSQHLVTQGGRQARAIAQHDCAVRLIDFSDAVAKPGWPRVQPAAQMLQCSVIVQRTEGQEAYAVGTGIGTILPRLAGNQRCCEAVGVVKRGAEMQSQHVGRTKIEAQHWLVLLDDGRCQLRRDRGCTRAARSTDECNDAQSARPGMRPVAVSHSATRGQRRAAASAAASERISW